jgi:uracil-DNA glycosylase
MRSGGIEALVGRLADSDTNANAFNQYARIGQPEAKLANELRRENLRLYLRQMAGIGPRAMLVGEAPGYRGCRLTGVPFTSEKILLRGLNVESEQRACQILGFECGYRKTAERERVIGEASATMVWETIANLQPLPLLWNAYPFHPYRPGQPLSNRPPSARELRSGGEFLAELLRLYAVDTVVAVGNSAANGLKQAGLPFLMVRHPSHGGKTKFVAGLESVADETGAFRQARAN